MSTLAITGAAIAPYYPGHVGGIEGPWWAAWNADPQVLIPAALVLWIYVRGLRRSRLPHPWWRTGLFVTGLAVIVLALQSPIDRLGEHHFVFHMVQHELLTMVGVPFMLLGAPTTPMLLGLSRGIRQAIIRPLAGNAWLHRIFRVLTHPVVAAAHLIVATTVWHMPFAFDAALRDSLIHQIQHTSFLVGSAFFWWNVIDPAPLRSRLSYPQRILYLLPSMVQRIIIGAFLTFSTEPWYRTYLEMTPFIPLSPLEDQQLGGLLMWVPMEIVNVAIIGVLFFMWAARSQRPTSPPDAAVACPTSAAR